MAFDFTLVFMLDREMDRHWKVVEDLVLDLTSTRATKRKVIECVPIHSCFRGFIFR